MSKVPYRLHSFDLVETTHALDQVKAALLDEQQLVSQRRLVTFKERLIQDWNGSRKTNVRLAQRL